MVLEIEPGSGTCYNLSGLEVGTYNKTQSGLGEREHLGRAFWNTLPEANAHLHLPPSTTFEQEGSWEMCLCRQHVHISGIFRLAL